MCDQSNNNCDICSSECGYEYHICKCGKVVCLNCIAVCDGCGELTCKSCFDAAKKIGGGLNAANTGCISVIRVPNQASSKRC